MTTATVSLITTERALVFASVLLAAVVPLWLLWPDQPALEASTPSLTVTPVEIFDPAEPNTALAAPLFNPDRSAPVLTAENAASPEPAPADNAPVPVGLITGRKAGGLALLRLANGETTIARTGEIVDGWSVISISRSAVSLRRGNDERQLTLDYSNRETQAGTQSPQALTQ